LLVRVLEEVLVNLRELEQAVERTEIRMIGASMLILWEGDEQALEAALERTEGDLVGDESDGSSAGGELGGTSSSLRGGPSVVVRLIDFAHTRGVPGEGPDMGVLQGLQTFIRLVRGRIDQLK
jgi:inositol-polyphosphate multikinase